MTAIAPVCPAAENVQCSEFDVQSSTFVFPTVSQVHPDRPENAPKDAKLRLTTPKDTLSEKFFLGSLKSDLSKTEPNLSQRKSPQPNVTLNEKVSRAARFTVSNHFKAIQTARGRRSASNQSKKSPLSTLSPWRRTINPRLSAAIRGKKNFQPSASILTQSRSFAVNRA